MKYKLKLKKITKLLMEHRKYKEPEDINYGDCWIWAVIANKVIKHSKLYESINSCLGHAFIKIGQCYFDSEEHFGVKNWMDLPFFKRENDNSFILKLTKDKALHSWAQNDLKDETKLINKISLTFNKSMLE